MNFVILSYARSGSTWLVNTINNIPGVTCYDELFTLKAEMYQAGGQGFPRYLDWQKSQKRPFLWNYLNSIYQGKDNSGFKLVFHQVKANPGLVPYAIAKRLAVIHLIRRNILDVVLSLLSAKKRGKFHYKENEKLPELQPFQVDVEFVVRRIKKNQQNIEDSKKMLKLLPLHSLEIAYEDLVANTDHFRPIWELFGVDFAESPPQSQMKKIVKNPLHNIVNHEELRRALNNAGFGHFLETDGSSLEG